MDKITFIKHLVRLSQIAEEIQETNPQAASLIDENINDISNNFGQQNVQTPSQSLFPPATPLANSNNGASNIDPNVLEGIANEVVEDIVKSGKIDKILQENPPDLNDRVNAVIDETLSRHVD